MSLVTKLREARAGREHPRDKAGLIAQLRSGTAEQRLEAARALAEHPDSAAMLGAQLVGEADPSVREALFISLSELNSEAAATALLPLLRSADAQLRSSAIEGLAGMPRAVAPRVDALLRDNDPEVRIFTIKLLGDLRHEQVTAWLLQVLRDEPSVNGVACAVELLAEAGQPEHIGALQAARQRFGDDPFLAFAIDVTIERIEASRREHSVPRPT
jgi:HEAT repeat protein